MACTAGDEGVAGMQGIGYRFAILLIEIDYSSCWAIARGVEFFVRFALELANLQREKYREVLSN